MLYEKIIGCMHACILHVLSERLIRVSLIKIHACFSILRPYYGTVYDLHRIILNYGLFMNCMLSMAPYMIFYDFHIFVW